MDTPPALTPERIDLMLSIMAEVCLESVVEAGRFQKAAEDVEAFERSGRALQRACRNLRQTIAMKQRHDREQAARADEGRKALQAERAEAERMRRQRVDRRTADLERHFERVLWDEYEPADAQELFEELAMRVKDAGFEDDFLDTPTEALIARFADEIGIVPTADHPSAPSPVRPGKPSSAAKPHSTAEDAEISAEDAETPCLRDFSEPSAASAVESDACGAHQGPPPDTPPPDPPPEPRPEPYVPPWEHLRRGQSMPGGTGW